MFLIIVVQINLVNSYISFLLSYLAIFTFYAWLIFVKWYKHWVTFIDVGTLSQPPPIVAFLLITLSDLKLYFYYSFTTDSGETEKP